MARNKIHAADDEPTYTDKSKSDAETCCGVKQRRSSHGDKSCAEERNECCAGKRGQGYVNGVQGAEQ